MLFLNNDDVRQVLTPDLTIEALLDSYGQLDRGEAVIRPRIDINIPIGRPDAYFKWGTMEGGSATAGYFASRIKIDIRYRTEYESEHDAIVSEEKYSTRPGLYCGLIVLVKTENAEPVAIINDSAIQRLRVGADAAIGTHYLARKDAEVLGFLGSGGMARTQLASTLALRKNVRKVQVFSPTREHREAFAAEVRQKYEIEAVAFDNPADVYKGADVVAACSDGGFRDEENNATLIGRYLEPGQHWTAVGGGADSEAYRRTDVALRNGITSYPGGLAEWGKIGGSINYAVPAENPKYADDRFYVASFAAPESVAVPSTGIVTQDSSRRGGDRLAKAIFLADLIAGRVEGRTSDEQITFSTSGGVQGAQFYPVAARVYELAKERGIGRDVPTDWFLQDERD